MNLPTLSLILLAALPLPASAREAGPEKLVQRFLAAWDAADAKGLAALFAPDADFVSPFGMSAQGRANIAAFYAAAFTRGYTGSKAAGEIVRQRSIGRDLVLIDARFSIAGARNEDGSPRPAEKGIMAAVLQRRGADWRIVALRENEGASDFSAFPPQR